MNNKKTGKFISELRKEKNWTQDDLANEMFLDRATISKWERGLYIPSTDHLLKLHKLFNVSVNEILYGERLNAENKDKINTISSEILENNKKKGKKTIIASSLVFLLLLLIAFLVYYFFSTYNSINIYVLDGYNGEFYVEESLLCTTKKQGYIKMGKIKNNSDLNIKKVRLYYKKDSEDKMIYSGPFHYFGDQVFLVEYNGKTSFISEDIDNLKNNLYLDILCENDETYIIKLNSIASYSDSSLIN